MNVKSPPMCHEYVVLLVKFNNDTASIKLNENAEYEIIFKIRLDDYLNLNYQNGTILSHYQYEELERLHRYRYAFDKCIRKLTASDKTEQEINNILRKIEGLDADDCSKIISELKNMGYICDYGVAETQLYLDQQRLLGKNKSAFNMKKRGISQDVIDELINTVDSQQEIERGVSKAKLLLKGINAKSYRETINILYNRLYGDGFDNIALIIDAVGIEKDDNKEQQQLEIMVEKAINKYNKKYQGRDLYSHIYKYLVSKGFDRDNIATLLNRKEFINEN